MRLRPAPALRLGGLPEPAWVYGGALLVTAAATAWFAWRGPMPVVRGSTPLPIPTPLYYQVSVFIPFGILAGEYSYAWLHPGGRPRSPAPLYQLAALCAVAIVRLGWSIPLSGHALLLAFFILHEAITRRLDHPVRLAIGVVVLAEVAYFKLVVWNDAPTLLWGLLLGCAIWAAGLPAQAQQKRIPPQSGGLKSAKQRPDR